MLWQLCGQDYVKSRNAAYGNNSAAIGSQKRVRDSMHYFSEENNFELNDGKWLLVDNL